MTYFLIISALLVILMVLAIWLGKFMGKQSQKRQLLSGALALFILGIQVLLHFSHELVIHHFPLLLYSYLETWWALPPVLFLISLGGKNVNRIRRIIYLSVVGSIIYWFCSSRYDVLTIDYSRFIPLVDSEGYRLQTTNFTCAPVSIANYFKKEHNIELYESEIAKLCLTTESRGTSNPQIAYALEKIIKTYKIDKNLRFRKIQKINKEELSQILPCLASIKLSLAVNHLLYLKEIKKDNIILVDPMYGAIIMKVEEFQRKSAGDFFYLQDNFTQIKK